VSGHSLETEDSKMKVVEFFEEEEVLLVLKGRKSDPQNCLRLVPFLIETLILECTRKGYTLYKFEKRELAQKVEKK